ncbi:site-specific integrase [soil metagenome]
MRGTVESYTTKAGERRWKIRYDRSADPETGQRRQAARRGFTTKRDADRSLREALDSVEGGTYVERDTKTVRDFLVDEWLPSRRPRGHESGRRSRGQLGASTWQGYSDYVRIYVVPTLGGHRLQNLTPAHVNRAYDQLETSGRKDGGGVSPKTLANVHGLLHKAMDDAVRLGYVPRNPLDLVDAPRPEKSETTVWAMEELRAFIEHVQDDRLYALWLLYASTGLRRGEALGLTWDVVDLDAGTVTVAWTLGAVQGKPRWKPRPKSDASRRTLALDPVVVEPLRALRKRQMEERLLVGPAWQQAPADGIGVSREGVVFTWPDGGLINPERVTKWFARHVAAAGLPHCRLHDVRHAYATAALRTATNWSEVKTLSRRLGHASVGETVDRYSHALPVDDREQAATMARLLLG